MTNLCQVLSYFRREIYTICYLLAGAWPLAYGPAIYRNNKILMATWMTACGLMSKFTLLPVIKVEDNTVM